MARTRIEVEIPHHLWVSEASRHHPGVAFLVLSFMPLERETGLILMKLEGPSAQAALKEIRNHSSVVEVAVMSSHPDSVIASVKTRGVHPVGALLESEVIVETPFKIENGSATWIVLAQNDKIGRLTGLLETRGVRHEVKSIERYEEVERLTKRQRELLDRAMAEGYFEVPRRITLTALAGKLGVSKSTLSESLRRIERRMVRRP